MRKTNLLFASFFLLFCYLPSSYAKDYFTIQEYQEKHPQQVVYQNSFNTLIQNKGVPVDKKLQNKPVKIAFVYPGKQVSDYWRRSISSFTRRMDEIGLQYKIFEYFTKANIEVRTQEKQLQEALSEDPDYLVYTLSVMRHRNLIERILTRGRPKLILQNITTPLKDWEGIQPFLYVGFDHVVGTIDHLAKKIIELTGGHGKYAVLYFDQGYISSMRGDSLIKYLQNNSKLKLVASYYTDGQRGRAKSAALDILTNHRVKFIYACSTDIAMGVIDALSETKKNEAVLVNGWGGGSSELAAIQNGKMDFTVMRMNDDNGIAMAEAIRLDVEGVGVEVPVVFSGEFVTVEKKMAPEKIQSLKKRAFRYSGVD